MKVDVITTQFGDVEVEYSTFTKGFFIKQFPEKLKNINGLKLLTSRDNSFEDYKKLDSYVRELVQNACVDFEFKRKVIFYKITSHTDVHTDSLSFEYLVCNESVKNQNYLGKSNALSEYVVLDSNLTKYLGKRNIFGQITFRNESDYVCIDYDENIHNFLKEFTAKFQNLKISLMDFFKEDKIQINILNHSFKNNLLGNNNL